MLEDAATDPHVRGSPFLGIPGSAYRCTDPPSFDDGHQYNLLARFPPSVYASITNTASPNYGAGRKPVPRAAGLNWCRYDHQSDWSELAQLTGRERTKYLKDRAPGPCEKPADWPKTNDTCGPGEGYIQGLASHWEDLTDYLLTFLLTTTEVAPYTSDYL